MIGKPQEKEHACDKKLQVGNYLQECRLRPQIQLDHMLIREVDNLTEDNHKETDKCSYVHSQILVEWYLGVGDRNRHISDRVLLVQLIIILNLFADLMCRVEQPDNLVSLRGSVYLFHDSCSGRTWQVNVDRMPGEEQHLVSFLCSVFRCLFSLNLVLIHGDLDTQQVLA